MQGASDRPKGKAGGTLASHAADLGALVRSLPRAPVMVGHSFGGLVVQRCGFDNSGLWRHCTLLSGCEFASALRLNALISTQRSSFT